jgi:hypothetical protein
VLRGPDDPSIIGVQINQDPGLNDTEFGVLVATPILTTDPDLGQSGRAARRGHISRLSVRALKANG